MTTIVILIILIMISRSSCSSMPSQWLMECQINWCNPLSFLVCNQHCIAIHAQSHVCIPINGLLVQTELHAYWHCAQSQSALHVHWHCAQSFFPCNQHCMHIDIVCNHMVCNQHCIAMHAQSHVCIVCTAYPSMDFLCEQNCMHIDIARDHIVCNQQCSHIMCAYLSPIN